MRAGNAGDGNVIDKAAGGAKNDGKPRGVTCRRDQADEIKPGLPRRQAQLVILLGRQVDNDQPVNTGRHRVSEKGIHAIDIDWVVIAHQHQRRIRVADPEIARHLQCPGKCHASLQRPQRCCLNGRAIGHRVGKWHAKFDHVDICLNQSVKDGVGCVAVGVASRNKYTKNTAILGTGIGKGSFDS